MDAEYFKTREAVMESMVGVGWDECPKCGLELIFNENYYNKFVDELSRRGYKIFKEIKP